MRSLKSKRYRYAILASILLLLLVPAALVGLGVVVVPTVHADSAPTIVQQTSGGHNSYGGASGFSLAFSSPVTAGNVVVVAIDLNFAFPSISSVTDTFSTKYSQAVTSSSTGAYAYIYNGTLSFGGSDTIVVNFGASTSTSDAIEVNIYEISGVTTSSLTTGTGNGTTSGDATAATISASSASFSSDAFLLGTVALSAGLSTYSAAGSGFTLSTTSTVEGYSEYATSGIASPTTFPLTICENAGGSSSSCTGNSGVSAVYNWAEAGIALNPVPLTAAPPSYTASQVVLQNGGGSDSGVSSSFEIGFASGVTAGDVVVVAIDLDFVSPTVSGVTDSLGSSYVQAATSSSLGTQAYIYCATLSSSASSDVITVDLSSSGTASDSVQVNIYEVSGVPTSGLTTGTGSGTTLGGFGVLYTTSTSSTTFTGGAFLLGTVAFSGGEPQLAVAGTGFTISNTYAGEGYSEYGIGTASPTTFPFNICNNLGGSTSDCDSSSTSNYGWAEAGIALNPPAPVLDSGQSITLTANPSGGIGSYSYQWYTSSGCSSPVGGATSSTYSVSPTTTTTYYYKVTDSSSDMACSAGTTVTVDSALIAGAITPASPSIDSGQITLTAHPSGGTGSYAYQWYSGSSSTCSSDSIVSGATSSTYSPSPTSSTYYCYTASDSSYNPPTMTSATDLVTVHLLSAGAITPQYETIDSGQSITLTANPSGGTGSYSYQWYTASGCSTGQVSGATSSTYSASPTTTTTYYYLVTDSASFTACSSGDTVTVDSALTAGAITPSSPTIDSGQSVTLTANPSGGTIPYAYQWYSGSSPTCSSDSLVSGATSSTYSASPTTSTYYCYTVTDESNIPNTMTSVTDLVTVELLTAGAITPSSPTVDSGFSITLTANPSGGTGTYTNYQWYTSSGCNTDQISGATSSTYSASPTTTTTYYYLVTDSASGTACSAGDTVTVDSALIAGAVTPSNPSISTSGSVTLTADPSGGTGSYTITWYDGVSGVCSSDSSSGETGSTFYVSIAQTDPYGSSTYFCYTVTDTSTSTPTVYSATDLVIMTGYTGLKASAITPPSLSIDPGHSATLYSLATGGSGGYTYQWYTSSDCSTSPISGATSSTYSASPATTTTYYYKVTDSSSDTACSAGDTITLNQALTAPTLKVVAQGSSAPGASAAISLGEYSILIDSGHFSGGLSPYTCQWLQEAPGAGSFSDLGSSFSSGCATTGVGNMNTGTLSTAGTWSFELQVTDSGGPNETVTSASVTVTVLAAGAITPSSPTIDSGQSVTLTANPSGGSGSYSYQWYTGSTCNAAVSGATLSTFSASPTSTTTYSYTVYSSISVCSAGDTVTVNAALAAGAITPSSPTIENGQSVTLTAHASGGTASYTYQWYSGSSSTCSSDSLVSGATSSTYSASPTTSTYYCYTVSDTSTNAPTISSSTDQVTVAAIASTTTTITCLSSTISFGGSTTCTATVTGAGGSISGEMITWSQTAGTGSASFSPGTACTLSGTSCSITVIGAAAGSATIKASYPGDSGSVGSSNTFALTVSKATTTTMVSCAPSSVATGVPTSCTATVSGGPSPSGTVDFITNSGTGTFTSTSCTLTGSHCAVSYTDTARGSPTITAIYLGDSNNAASQGTTMPTITSTLAATTTSVSCVASSVSPGSTTTCTVTVTGSSPTGTVSWSSSSTTPSFSSASCLLVSGSCFVTYSDGTSGAPVITATYGGDSNNGASSGKFILSNFGSTASTTGSSGTTLSSGGGTVNQGSTGVDVVISGASGSSATVFSADLSSAPPGTGSLNLGNAGFYDVEITGATGGTANVCLMNSNVDANTVLQYYSGGTWVSATGITRTIGVEICGNVPVSALTGTYFTEGDPLPGVTSTGPPASLVYGNITWTTPNFVGYEYFYTASVSINGVQFSATFTETLFAQYQLTPGQPYAGLYGSTFGAISGCGQGSTITLTATVNGVTKSASGICPVAGNTTAINLAFTTTSGGTTSALPIAPILLSYLISSLQPAILIACFLGTLLLGKKLIRPFSVGKTAGIFYFK